MKLTLLISVALRLAFAQDSFDDLFAAYNSAASRLVESTAPLSDKAAEQVTYSPSRVVSSAVADATSGTLHRRQDACQPYAPGFGPVVTEPNDDDASFLSFAPFSDLANNAIVPKGYSLSSGFRNLQGSVSGPSYLGYNGTFTSYDVTECAQQCDMMEGCVSFNMFFERNPTVNANDQSCPNPPSLTRIKCSFWGIPVTTDSATNSGQWQSQFHVVIAGSNAYTNVPSVPQGFINRQWIQNAAIMSPIADETYMGVQTFENTAYNPQVCADACSATSAYNLQHPPSTGSPRICNFFNAYVLYKNSASPVFTCTYYTQAYDASYAKNTGQWDSQGNHYTIDHSYTFTVSG